MAFDIPIKLKGFCLFIYSREKNDTENEQKNQSVKLRSRFVSKILFKSEKECEIEEKKPELKTSLSLCFKNFIQKRETV